VFGHVLTFMPFFAFKELGRMLGEGKIGELFFHSLLNGRQCGNLMFYAYRPSAMAHDRRGAYHSGMRLGFLNVPFPAHRIRSFGSGSEDAETTAASDIPLFVPFLG